MNWIVTVLILVHVVKYILCRMNQNRNQGLIEYIVKGWGMAIIENV